MISNISQVIVAMETENPQNRGLLYLNELNVKSYLVFMTVISADPFSQMQSHSNIWTKAENLSTTVFQIESHYLFKSDFNCQLLVESFMFMRILPDQYSEVKNIKFLILVKESRKEIVRKCGNIICNW